MANLIKPTAGRTATRGTEIPFEDLSRRAERCLEEARGQAAALCAEAQRERDELRREMQAQWRREAEAEFDARVAAEVEQRLAGLVPALREASRAVAQTERAAQATAESACLQVAMAIAERIIRRELRASSDVPLALVREALELAGASPRIRVLVSRADEPALRPQIQALIAGRGLSHVEIVADPAITPGACRVETAQGVIDQQIETQLRRMFEELSA